MFTTFLSLLDLQGETAEAISTTLTQFLDTIGLDFIKCVRIGTDGCSVMFGRKNSD